MEQYTEPAVLDSKSSQFQFHIPICDRCEPVNQHPPSDPAAVVIKRKIYGCSDIDGMGLFTISNPYFVHIKELVYPGEKNNWKEIENKWLYAFRDNELIAEVQAVKKGQWEGYSKINGNKMIILPHERRTLGQLELDPGPKESRYTYYFLLSPVQLTENAINYLLSDPNHTKSMAYVFCDTLNKQIRVPDPFSWTVDVSNQYLKPLIEKCLAYQTDEERSAQLFIASTLKAWIDHDGDKMGITDKLEEGQPDQFLDDYKKQNHDLWEKAEKATAYLAHCIESVEFAAINKACMETGLQAMSTAYQVWAMVTENITKTKAGYTLAMRILNDKESLPSKFIFHPPGKKPEKQIDFANSRWGYLAAIKTYENLFSAFIETLSKIKKEVTNADVIEYLGNINFSAELKGNKKVIHRNLREGKSITSGIKSSKKKAKIERTFKKLTASDAIKNMLPRKYDKTVKSLDAVATEFEPCFKSIKLSLGTFFDIANLSISVANFQKSENITSQEEFLKKLNSVAGASADLSAHLLDCMEDVIKRQAAKNAAKAAASIAGIFASVSDMIDFEKNALDAAFGKYDYGKAFGHGVQTLGAACSAYSAAAVIAGLGAAPETFGIAAIIGVIGAVLISAGGVVATWLQDSAHEEFAKFSFLGNKKHADRREPIWSSLELPTTNAMKESDNLIALLSNFSLRSHGAINGHILAIYPRYLEKNSVFEIESSINYRNYNKPASHCKIMVYVDTDEIVVVNGDINLEKNSEVVRDENDNINYIYLNLKETDPEPFTQYDKTTVNVRLNVRDDIFIPKEDKKNNCENWSTIEVLRELDTISSLDTNHWITRKLN
ncbi:MAG: hypothetical protein GY874_17940 [Desulfobacteraceae bacterium]|nr:hypothetical protein [Desulfobacteraceae bacterium]